MDSLKFNCFLSLSARLAAAVLGARLLSTRSLSLMGAIATMVAVQTSFSASATAAWLSDWQFDEAENQLEVTVQEGTTPRYFLLESPWRIVIDLPDTEVGEVPPQQTYVGVVREIRISQFQPGLTRIVMELSPDINLASQPVQLQLLESSEGNTRWGVRPLLAQGQTFAPSSRPTAQPDANLPALPPPTFWTNRVPRVSVPPLNRPQSSSRNQSDVETPGASAADLNVQPRSILPAPTPVVAQPEAVPIRIERTAEVAPEPDIQQINLPVAPSPASNPKVVPVIEFGQPLPRTNLTNSGRGGEGTILAASTAGILPAGTLLTLRYPGTRAIELEAGTIKQEVLLLQTDIRDERGNILIAAGTNVIGRFETTRRGSRFITQAMTIGDRNFALEAESNILNDTAQPAIIQPSQTLQVRLVEDFSRR